MALCLIINIESVHYNRWHLVTTIQLADTDGKRDTIADPT